MLAFILVLYCCIQCKACYIVRNKRWPRARRKKREVAKGQEKAKEKKKNKAEGLSKKRERESTKCLCMPKAFELKEKLREAQNA